MSPRVASSPHSARPPLRADHVGSFLRPAILKETIERVRTGEADAAELKVVQDACIRDVVALQEAAGFEVVTDGEFRHTSFHHFLEQIEGIASNRPKWQPGAAIKSFEPRTYTITGKLRHRAPIELESFRYLASLTDRTPKVTLVSPTMLLRAGREAISREAYPDLAEFVGDVASVYRAEIAALAAAGCTYVQLDDTNFAYLCDPELRARRQLGGSDPDMLAHRYAELINSAISGRPADMAACIHICRGNAGGHFAARGGYEPIAEVLLNEVAVDGYFLEYDDERSGGFEPLRFLPKGSAKVVLGLVTTKSPALETKDALKRRIEEAARIVPLENLCLSPQCGFASSLEGSNPVTESDERRKLELIVETAQEVWGTAA